MTAPIHQADLDNRCLAVKYELIVHNSWQPVCHAETLSKLTTCNTRWTLDDGLYFECQRMRRQR